MKRTRALVTIGFALGAALLMGQTGPRPGGTLPASKVTVSGLPTCLDLQCGIDNGEVGSGGSGVADSFATITNGTAVSRSFVVGASSSITLSGTGAVTANRIGVTTAAPTTNGQIEIDSDGDGSTNTNDELSFRNGGENFFVIATRARPTLDGQVPKYSAATHDYVWGSSVSDFTTMIGGTNTNQAFTVGTNSSLGFTNNGTITANRLQSTTFPASITGQIAFDNNGNGSTVTKPVISSYNAGIVYYTPMLAVADYPTADGQVLTYRDATKDFGFAAPPSGGGGGGATGPSCVELYADDIKCKGTGGCNPALTDGTDNTYATVNFNTSTDSQGSANFTVPAGFTGTTATVTIDWLSDDAACNNEATDDICLTWVGGSVAPGAAFKAPTLTGANGVNSTCVASGQLVRETRTGYVHGMFDGQRGVFTLKRIVSGTPTGCASADDYTQDAKIVAVTICPE